MKIISVLLVIIATSMIFAEKSEYDFELYQLDDSLYVSQKARKKSKFLVVDFFSVFCEPCKKAIPELDRLYKKYREKGLEVVVVALPAMEDREAEAVKLVNYFKKYSLPVVFDKYKLTGKSYGVVSGDGNAELPYLFVFDKEGKKIVEEKENENKVKSFIKKQFKQ